MGYWRTNLSPRVVDFACSSKGMARWRARCVEELSGTVVEIGFGAGRNLAFYPATVTELIAIEPSAVMRKRAAKQIAQSKVPVRWGGLDGQHLELADNSVDGAVVTFALCTIPDAASALRELRRVVRPGGELRALEHGLAPDESVRKWQHRLNGLEHRVADGCQLVRDPLDLIEQSPWNLSAKYQRYAPGLKPWAYLTSLRAN